MLSNLAEVSWTAEQWNVVSRTVTEEAQRARVAAQFLSCTGPLDPSVVAVPEFRLSYPRDPNRIGAPRRMRASNLPDLALTSISTLVELPTSEVSDPDLGAALAQFRRAANILARVEDALVFNDRIGPFPPLTGTTGVPPVYVVTGGNARGQTCLLPLDFGLGPITSLDGRLQVTLPLIPIPPQGDPARPAALLAYGEFVVGAIVQAINLLEDSGQTGPFACVLGPLPYEAVYTPNSNFVAAKDRILPMLNGPLLRSSTITSLPNSGQSYAYGVVVALGGSPVELVVAADMSVRFLQVTLEPRYVFRVSERIALRVKDPRAIVALTPPVTWP